LEGGKQLWGKKGLKSRNCVGFVKNNWGKTKRLGCHPNERVIKKQKVKDFGTE